MPQLRPFTVISRTICRTAARAVAAMLLIGVILAGTSLLATAAPAGNTVTMPSSGGGGRLEFLDLLTGPHPCAGGESIWVYGKWQVATTRQGPGGYIAPVRPARLW